MFERPSQMKFRAAMLLFAIALAGLSLWVLAPQWRPATIDRLPMSVQAAHAAVAERAGLDRAARAARIRGDLWAQLAFTYASPLWPGAEEDSDPRTVAAEGRGAIQAALASAPYEPGIWLLAASLGSQFDWATFQPNAALKMSYYVGPNEAYLVPLRLFAAAHSNALEDSEIKQFVERDVRLILTRWGEFKSALTAVYKDAPPKAQRFFEAAVSETDPAFLQALQGSARH